MAPMVSRRRTGVTLRQVPLDAHPLAGCDLLPYVPYLIEGSARRRWFTPFPEQPVQVSEVIMLLKLFAAFGDHSPAGRRSFAIGATEGRSSGDAMPEPAVEAQGALDGVSGQVMGEPRARCATRSPADNAALAPVDLPGRPSFTLDRLLEADEHARRLSER